MSIPIVLYHGSKPWHWAKSFQKTYFPNIACEFTGRLEYVVDVHDPKVQAIFKDKSFKTRGLLWLLAEIRAITKQKGPKAEKKLQEILTELAEYSGKPNDYMMSVVDYAIASGITQKSLTKIETQLIIQGHFKPGGLAMNIRKDLIQRGKIQGMQKGMQQGIQKNKLDMARKLLRRGMTESAVIEITGLPLVAIKKLKNDPLQ